MSTESTLDQVAGGGLLSRRSFLRSGLVFSIALSADSPASSREGDITIGDNVPNWMKVPGGNHTPHGIPATHETQIQRSLTETTPQISLQRWLGTGRSVRVDPV